MMSGCQEDGINLPQQPIISGALFNECPQPTVLLTANATDAISFRWKKDGTIIEGQTTSTLTVSESGAYTVAGINEAGIGAFSDPKYVTISDCFPQQAIITGALFNECPELIVLLTASVTDAISFQWKKDGTVIEGQTTSTLIVSESGAYTVAGINEAGIGAFSVPKYVTIFDCLPLQAIITGSESNVFPETTVLLTASAGDATSFQWKKDGTVIEGQTTSTLIVSESGVYTVAGINEIGIGVFSEPVSVTISDYLPLRAVITGAESNVFPETTVLLTASAGDATSFQWKKDGTVIEGQTASTLIVSESGAYTVAGINEAGIGAFSEIKNITISFSPPSAGFTYLDNTDFFTFTSTSTGDISTYNWQISGSQQVAFVNPTVNSTTLELSSATKTVTVSLTVSNDWGYSTSSQEITLPELTFQRRFGLGRNLSAMQRNAVAHEWYIDQGNTGVHSRINCGPASAVMAIKWANPYFTGTAEEARNTFHPGGGWWSTSNIVNYLNMHNTSNFIASFRRVDQLMTQLDNGNIAILCLDMFYIRNHVGNPEWRIDKYYTTASRGWGHFIVVKGYKEVDGIVWFEVYDPWSLGLTNSDGTFKGRGRFYRDVDIIQATSVWWNNMIVVRNPANPVLRSEGIDPSTVIHQSSRKME